MPQTNSYTKKRKPNPETPAHQVAIPTHTNKYTHNRAKIVSIYTKHNNQNPNHPVRNNPQNKTPRKRNYTKQQQSQRKRKQSNPKPNQNTATPQKPDTYTNTPTTGKQHPATNNQRNQNQLITPRTPKSRKHKKQHSNQMEHLISSNTRNTKTPPQRNYGATCNQNKHQSSRKSAPNTCNHHHKITKPKPNRTKHKTGARHHYRTHKPRKAN